MTFEEILDQAVTMLQRQDGKDIIEMEWPDWWEWELELSPHLEKRMVDQDFTEIDLRAMLENAEDYRLDVVEGHWIIETRHRRNPWHVIVEPDSSESLLVVVTAYRVDR